MGKALVFAWTLAWLVCALEVAPAAQGKPCRGETPCYCDYLKAENPKYTYRNLEHSVEPSFFPQEDISRPDYSPFEVESNIKMMGEHIFYIDGEQGDSVIQSVRELILVNYAEFNFATPEEQIRKREKLWPNGEFKSRATLPDSYLMPVEESIVRLYFDVWQTPTQLWIENNPHDKKAKAAWVDISATKAQSFNYSGLYLKNRESGNLELVPPTPAYLLRLANATNTVYARFKPSISTNYLAFTEYYPELDTSLSLLYNIETGGFMTLGHLFGSRRHALLRVQSYGALYDKSVAFWVETSYPVNIDHKRGTFVFESGIPLYALPDSKQPATHLKLLFLPDWKHAMVKYTPPSSIARPRLQNVLVTASRVFLHVCDEFDGKNYFGTCIVQVALLTDIENGADNQLREIETTRTSALERLQLQAGSGEWLLFWKGEELHIYTDNRKYEGEFPLEKTCKFDPELTAEIVSVSLFLDTVLFVSKQNGTLSLFDVDKDNDGVLDVEDAFPLDGLEVWDSDNDGIGDGADIINMSHRSCASLDERNACLSDNVLLYILFVLYFVVALFAVNYASDRYHFTFFLFLDVIEEEILTKPPTNTLSNLSDESSQDGSRRSSTVVKSSQSLSPKNSEKLKQRFTQIGSGDSASQGIGENRNTMMKRVTTAQSKSKMSEAQNGSQYYTSMIQEKKGEFLQKHDYNDDFLALKEISQRMIASPDDFDILLPTFTRTSEILVRKMVRQVHPTLSVLAEQGRHALDILSVVSILTGYIPMTFVFTYGDDRFLTRTRHTFGWIDFYVSSVFFMSLEEQYRWSDLTLVNFFLKRWVDVFALITAPPGILEYMSNYYLFAQYLRLFLIFRLFRIYKRVFLDETLVHYIITLPNIFITILLVLFLLICAGIMSQVEVEFDPEGLGEFPKSLWFAAVTVTTVGYGDYSPLSQSGRAIALFMMIFGVGLVGTISGSIAKAIQTLGSTEEKVKQLKSDNRSRFEAFKDVLDSASLAYNPVLGTLSVLFTGKDEETKTDSTRSRDTIDEFHIVPPQTAKGNRFRFNTQRKLGMPSPSLAVNFPRQNSTTSILGPSGSPSHRSASMMSNKSKSAFPLFLPVAEVISNNNEWKNESTLGKSAANFQPRKKHAAREKFEHYLDAKNGACHPRIRIALLLESFQLDQYHSITNFEEFLNRLCRVILEPPKQHEIVLERALAICEEEGAQKLKHHNRHKLEENFDFSRYSLIDPLDSKLERMEKILSGSQYKLLKRVDYGLILTEMTLILLEYDRLLTAKWAYHNLEVKPGVTLPKAKRITEGKYQLVKRILSDLPDDSKQLTPQQYLEAIHGPKEEFDVPILQTPVHAKKSRFANLIRTAIRNNSLRSHNLSEQDSDASENVVAPAGVTGVSNQASSPAARSNKSETRKRSLVERIFQPSIFSNTRFGTSRVSSTSGAEPALAQEISNMLDAIEPEEQELEL